VTPPGIAFSHSQDPRHPYNLPHTIRNVLLGRMRPFPEHVSAGCREFISGLLRHNPAQRTKLQVRCVACSVAFLKAGWPVKHVTH
jgi:hypothetical protein